MKLLEKKQINAAVQTERKSVIDSGISLAKKVDKLRDELLDLQKQRSDFIANSKRVITESIEGLKTDEGILKASVKQETKKLAKLREPLDEEWRILGEEKIIVSRLHQQGEEYVAGLAADRRVLDTTQRKVKSLQASAISNEKQSAKLLNQAQSDRNDAEAYLSDAKKLKEEKEVDIYNRETLLNDREKDLATREEALRIDRVALNKEKKLLAIKHQRIYGSV